MSWMLRLFFHFFLFTTIQAALKRSRIRDDDVVLYLEVICNGWVMVSRAALTIHLSSRNNKRRPLESVGSLKQWISFYHPLHFHEIIFPSPGRLFIEWISPSGDFSWFPLLSKWMQKVICNWFISLPKVKVLQWLYSFSTAFFFLLLRGGRII